MDIPTIMQSARSKVEWANRHIDTMIRDSAPLTKELHELKSIPARSKAVLREPDFTDLTYFPKKPVSQHFALIIGDSVHNLRSALDHFSTALVNSVNPGKRSARTSFPFDKKRKTLETHRAYKTIHTAMPDAAEFIRDEIIPCSDGNFELWTVTKLDNVDKHDFILPVVSVTEIRNLNVRHPDGSIVIDNCNFRNDANHKFILSRYPRTFTVDNNFETSVKIAFPKGGFFENQPVILTLENLSNVVSETLDALEGFLVGHAKK